MREWERWWLRTWESTIVLWRANSATLCSPSLAWGPKTPNWIYREKPTFASLGSCAPNPKQKPYPTVSAKF